MRIWQRSTASALALTVAFVLIGNVASAHHGRAGYGDQISTVKGTVTEVQWKNPHVFIAFDVKDDKGNVVHWLAELSSPATMRVVPGFEAGGVGSGVFDIMILGSAWMGLAGCQAPRHRPWRAGKDQSEEVMDSP